MDSEEIPKIDNAELKKAFSQINKTSPGEDCRITEMLKMRGKQLKKSVRSLLNNYLTYGKNTEIVLKGDRITTENYRSFNFLSHLYKPLTKIITD